MAEILVTGGAGFIGSNLTEALLRQGHSVRVLDNFSTGKRENLVFEEGYSSLKVIEGDIAESKVCQSAMKRVEFVFHQAALPSVQQSVDDPLTSNRVNVEGTLNVLLSAKDAKVKRVVYASSCAIYGDDPALPKREEMAPQPLSPYALQKYIGEQYCRLFSQLYHLETVCLRYFNVFGPKQNPDSSYAAAIPRFIDALIQKSSPVVFGDGEQSRDFIYIEDVIQANLLAMSTQPLYGDVINVAGGRSLSLNRLLMILRNILDSKVIPNYQQPRAGDVRHSLGDIQKGKRLLHYTPRVEIKTGLEKTIAYFIDKRKEISRK
ncbi:MAG: Vi polysaccharide biosynthesis protein VipB/TviC [Deltaproteobacteria bacterium RBG_16_48_10]|nr:MAG: Vi polysaccharide biosynthesis protein VipB/TviC [Deltaproteobacteria bacterium RBG_16_48_10]